MNLEAINKWLDEEYGCSYTRLEELHNFYFKKYCDLQQENKQLKDNWNKLKKFLKNTRKENLEWDKKHNCEWKGYNAYSELLIKMQEIEQGSDSNDSN